MAELPESKYQFCDASRDGSDVKKFEDVCFEMDFRAGRIGPEALDSPSQNPNAPGY